MPFAGTTAPGSQSTPIRPTRALGAPQTTVSGAAPSPVSTVSTCSLSACGCFTAVCTLTTRETASFLAGFFTHSNFSPMRLHGDTYQAHDTCASDGLGGC